MSPFWSVQLPLCPSSYLLCIEHSISELDQVSNRRHQAAACPFVRDVHIRGIQQHSFLSTLVKPESVLNIYLYLPVVVCIRNSQVNKYSTTWTNYSELSRDRRTVLRLGKAIVKCARTILRCEEAAIIVRCRWMIVSRGRTTVGRGQTIVRCGQTNMRCGQTIVRRGRTMWDVGKLLWAVGEHCESWANYCEAGMNYCELWANSGMKIVVSRIPQENRSMWYKHAKRNKWFYLTVKGSNSDKRHGNKNTYYSPCSVVYDGIIQVCTCVVHAEISEKLLHVFEEVLLCCPLDHSTNKRPPMSGIVVCCTRLRQKGIVLKQGQGVSHTVIVILQTREQTK